MMPNTNFSQAGFDQVLARFMKNQTDMVYLLNTNGYVTPSNISLKDVQLKFLSIIKDNPRFRQSVAAYMTEKVMNGNLDFVNNNEYLNDSGPDIATATGSTTVKPQTVQTGSGTTSGSSSGSWLGNVFNSSTVNNLLNTGLSALSTSLTAKANQTTNQQALESQQLQIQQLQAQQQLAATQAAANAAQKKGIPGWGWTLILLGVIGIAGTIAIIVVKKRRARRAAKAS